MQTAMWMHAFDTYETHLEHRFQDESLHLLLSGQPEKKNFGIAAALMPRKPPRSLCCSRSHREDSITPNAPPNHLCTETISQIKADNVNVSHDD